MKEKKILLSIISLFETLDFIRKTQIILLLLTNIFNGFLEFLTLASAGIFLESISDPEFQIQKYSIINSFLINNKNQVIVTSFIFIFFIALSSGMRIFNLWFGMKFRISLLIYIEEKVFKNIINQNFKYHVNHSSTEIITNLTKNIDKTGFFIENLLSLITSIILSLSLIFALLRLSFFITILTVILLSFLYLLVGILTNKKVDKYSKFELIATSNFLNIIQESIGSIKEIILKSNQEYYQQRFKKESYITRKYQGLNAFITTFPKYLFEGLGIIVISLAGLITFSYKGGNIIPLLGTFALGAQKLLPSLNTIYRSWSLLFFYNRGLNKINQLLKLKYFKKENFKEFKSNIFKKDITIKNLSYSINENENILNNINLKISKGESIGIIGKTGSGKTTLINLLMGLLEPTEGSIYVDDKDIFNVDNKKILFKWRSLIDYIPQKIFLINSTIESNIAFCVNPQLINTKKLNTAIDQACLNDFVNSKKNQTKDFVGEDGIKISGGQKQRIGIARTIYNDLDILIMDESTSALDSFTEEKVIKNIHNKRKTKTIITIAHKLKTLINCDKIIELEKGKIKSIITNKELKLKLEEQ